MRDAAGEEPELLERLRFAPLCLGALPCSDVAENEDDAGYLIFVIPNRRRHLLDDALVAVARSQSDVLGEI